jgi:hypothetical protein
MLVVAAVSLCLAASGCGPVSANDKPRYVLKVQTPDKLIHKHLPEQTTSIAFHDVNLTLTNSVDGTDLTGDLYINNDKDTWSLVFTTKVLQNSRSEQCFLAIERILAKQFPDAKIMRPEGLESVRQMVLDDNMSRRHSLSIARYPNRVIYKISGYGPSTAP